MGSHSAGKIKLTSFDDLMKTSSSEMTTEDHIVKVPISELYPFRKHPFRVLDDEKMQETVESIKRFGVLVPLIIRPCEGHGYEIVSGHRRKRGSELAGCKEVPAIIRNLTDDEATIIMVDSNIQREDILPSEKAWAYRMKMEALKHQGSKGENHTAEIVGKRAGDSSRTVQRLIRLTYLNEELLEAVDSKKITLFAGEKLSFLSEQEQSWVMQAIKETFVSPSGQQAEQLKAESEQAILTEDRVRSILEVMKGTSGISISIKRIREYFPPEYTKGQMEEVIFQLLKTWSESKEIG